MAWCRRLQPLPAGVPSPRGAPGATEPAGLPPALPHLRPAPHPPHRQRRPLRLLPGAGTALPTVGLVDPARHLARAHPARLPAAEWAPRTPAWHAQAGGDHSPRRVPLRTAIPLYPLPSRIQPETTPRGLGTKTSGRVLPALATSFSQKAAAPTLRTGKFGWSVLTEASDGVWEVWFGPLRLGRMDERQLTITDALGKAAPRKL